MLLMGEFTISMAMFNSLLLVYQRVLLWLLLINEPLFSSGNQTEQWINEQNPPLIVENMTWT